MAQLDGSLNSIVRLSGGGAHQSPMFIPQAGQLYRATVEQVNAGAVVLRIGDLNLKAVTDLAIRPGQTLLLRLNRNTDPPGLEVVRILPLPEHQTRHRQHPADEETINRRIQALVARQASPLMLFSLMSGLDPARYPPELSSLLRAVQSHLIPAGQLGTAEGLQAAVNSSGIWLEAILRAMTTNPEFAARLQDDLKLALVKLRAGRADGGAGGLVQLLDEGLASTLLQVTDGVLARMSLNQVHSVLQAEQGHLHWGVDLPVSLRDQTVMLALTIRREYGCSGGEADHTPQSWRVEVDTELERLGPIRVCVFLRDQHLSVALESTRSQTVELFERTLATLGQTLREQGFSVETLLSRPLTAQEAAASDTWYENIIEVSV